MNLTDRNIVGRHSRRGFTLVEMLVVMAIIVAMAAIALMFVFRQDSKIAFDGASQLQTWLASARSRALRDQTPTGLRLVANANGQFTAVQLIQSPEPLAPQSTMTVTAGSTTATFTPALLTPVQAGDLLEIVYGTGSIHRVLSASSTSTTTTVTLASIPPAAALSTLTLGPTNPPYHFIRQPLPLMGEPNFDLPSTVYISTSSSYSLPTSYSGATYDIIFAPSGEVINATTGRIIFYVTDTQTNGASISKPFLVTVYARTGAVAIHPVADSSNPNGIYAYTQDGLSSGQ